MTHPRSEKLTFPRSHGRMQPFADLYRFGGAADGAPLVLYVGGAIGRDDYVARSRRAPDPIAQEFERALGTVRAGPVSLLVCPCPIDIGGYDGFLDHFDQELLKAVGGSTEALGCVGYSAGGPLATYVGVLSGAKAVAVYGGAGMKVAADQIRTVVERTRDQLPAVALFRNVDDRVDDPLAVRRWLGGLDVTVAGARPGEHAFRYYSSNGTVVAAFRFVLERLWTEATP